eukprot:TRINITY_DN12240_c1_g3_i1.p1 TRINITY_DN12240_c1_g3~~TRINITY_DN12240_c1_g3_i1.p1  ORF type:complete len:178 (+),score=23.17 TRINITY_DN12240_c1_g3_i1:81-614(+)
MGSFFSRIFDKKIVNICMVGLQGGGKTTIFYKIFPYEVVPVIGGFGFNLESFEYRNLRVCAFDVGRSFCKLSPLWKHYFSVTDGLIFVVDSSDVAGLDEAKEALVDLLEMEELNSSPLLIFANKQDLPNALKLSDLIDQLDLYSLKNREWYVQQICAQKGSGILNGLQWLSQTLKKK